MRTEYRIDDFQESYFVIPSFEALFRETYKDFARTLPQAYRAARPIVPATCSPATM